MEGRKWGYYEGEGDLHLFSFAREAHVGFKEELVQCMNGWVLFTLEDVESLWKESLKYISKPFFSDLGFI